MAIGENEAITVDPLRSRRVMLQMIAPQHFGDVGHAHGRAGVTAARALHCIHGEGAHGIGSLETGGHGGSSPERACAGGAYSPRQRTGSQ